ncbi:hypothetical protein U1Q18_018683 [Sarracenia purpurea var. burkii]
MVAKKSTCTDLPNLQGKNCFTGKSPTPDKNPPINWNPHCADSEGNVPLWDAILGRHEAVIKLLVDNGAKISAGDVGQFACFDVEQNSLDLLKDIIRYSGDVTLLNSLGTTALHTAISEENTEIVKFLLEQGEYIDKPDVHGWTPRALANYQGHEEIKGSIKGRESGLLPSSCSSRSPRCMSNNKARVTISFRGNGELAGRLVFLPDSLQELLDVGAQKFGMSPSKVLMKDGALVEDIAIIRDGDHLILTGDGACYLIFPQ